MGQLTISHSGDEAEYRAVENTVAEPTLVRQLLCDLSLLSARATLVYCDNVSDIYLSSNSNYHQCTKHIEIDIHFVRDQVALGLFGFLMFHLVLNLQIFSLKDYLLLFFGNSFPISMFDLVSFRLRGLLD